jgi:hypothetical protein
VRIIRHRVFTLVLGAAVRVSALVCRFVDAHEARNISQNIFEVLVNLLCQIEPVLVD